MSWQISHGSYQRLLIFLLSETCDLEDIFLVGCEVPRDRPKIYRDTLLYLLYGESVVDDSSHSNEFRLVGMIDTLNLLCYTDELIQAQIHSSVDNGVQRGGYTPIRSVVLCEDQFCIGMRQLLCYGKEILSWEQMPMDYIILSIKERSQCKNIKGAIQ